MEEITYDTSLPWDNFLSKEILPNIYKKQTQVSALSALSLKISQSQFAPDDKLPYTIYRHLLELSSLHFTSYYALFDALNTLLKAVISADSVWDDTFVKNSIKFTAKTINGSNQLYVVTPFLFNTPYLR